MAQTILIADDSIFMRTKLKDIFIAAGYEVVGEATTGEEVVELYIKLRPDIVTMDIVMPEKTGLDALKEIIEYDSNAKVVLCSALDQESILIDALKLGAKNYITKPIDPKAVIDAIKKTLSWES